MKTGSLDGTVLLLVFAIIIASLSREKYTVLSCGGKFIVPLCSSFNTNSFVS